MNLDDEERYEEAEKLWREAEAGAMALGFSGDEESLEATCRKAANAAARAAAEAKTAD